MTGAKPLPISTAPGYDNQPMFSADGRRILFAANRDGRQINVFEYDRTSSRVSQLTHTPENENSPTYLPAGIGDSSGFSVVRTEPDRSQRLWRFDAQGRNPQVVLTDVKTGRVSRVGGCRYRGALRPRHAGDAADRQRQDRRRRDRRRGHRPFAAPHPRHARRELRPARGVRGVLDQPDRDALEEDRPVGQGRRRQRGPRHGLDA